MNIAIMLVGLVLLVVGFWREAIRPRETIEKPVATEQVSPLPPEPIPEANDHRLVKYDDGTYAMQYWLDWGPCWVDMNLGELDESSPLVQQYLKNPVELSFQDKKIVTITPIKKP